MNTIPLVKGNTQEEINTSLIALKKALDEIDSSSSKTDASVQSQIKQINELIENINTHLDTVDEQITDLQPVDTVTSGNMQSVTSNAVSEAIKILPHSKLVTLSIGADMNDCVDVAKIYYSASTSTINTFVNKPSFTGSGEMAVITLPLGSPNYLIQLYFAKDGVTRSIAHRVCTSGVWADWKQIATTEDCSPNYSQKVSIYGGTSAFNLSYTAPQNGYIIGSGYGDGQSNNYIYFSTSNGVEIRQQGNSNEYISALIPVRKGDVIGINMHLASYNAGVYFVPCN